MKPNLFFIGLTGLLTFSSFARAEDISYRQVVLQGLDKITGRLNTMTVNVGEKTSFGALDIYVRVCYGKPTEETPENSTFLDIVEKKEEGQLKLFSGWMFSSSPALSAMDHPVYDIWVLKCQGETVEPPAPQPLILENPIELKPIQPKLKISVEDENLSAENSSEPSDEEEQIELPVDPERISSETGNEISTLPEPERVVIQLKSSEVKKIKKEQEDKFKLIPIEESPVTTEIGEPVETHSETEDTTVFAEPYEYEPVDIPENETKTTVVGEPIPQEHILTPDNNDQNLSDNVTTQKGEPIVEEYLPVNSKRQPEQRELFSEEEAEMEKAIFQTPDELEE